MDASPRSVVDLITSSATRFVVPVFQRPYSWDEEHCAQLWDDVLAVGKDATSKHFTGSVVWVQDGTMSASGVTPLLLIDGQQRLTTVTLLYIALARYARQHGDADLAFSFKEILGAGYLVNQYKEGANRYKLTLSQGDRDTLFSIIDNLENPDVQIDESSQRIIDNLAFLERQVSSYDNPNIIWAGLSRLEVVSISLTQGIDNPQLIFESMNSTGKDLSSADLIRNYVLMGLSLEEQENLYRNYWRPIEETLGANIYDRIFDEFIRDYLTVCIAPEVPSKRDIYQEFKNHVRDAGYGKSQPIALLLKELNRFAKYYAAITQGVCDDADIKCRLVRISRLDISVVNPLLLSFFDDYESGSFTRDEFLEMLDCVESYLFRRAVCDLASHGLNKYLPSLIARLNKVQDDAGNYKEAFMSYLLNEANTARRFPSNAEFKSALKTRDVYSFRRSLYLLSRLENSYHPKDERNFFTSAYTIEHIMPQNALAHDEWLQILGDDAEATFDAYVNKLGNLTLTAYNSELSDASFAEKKARVIGGYDNEFITISSDLRELDSWGVGDIEDRAEKLAEKALSVWKIPQVDEAVRKSYLPVKKAASTEPYVTFRGLVAYGVLKPGTVLVSGNSLYPGEAVVTDRGAIRLSNGEEFKSPSRAIVRLMQMQGSSRTADNGWRTWHVGSVDGPSLDDLREECFEARAKHRDKERHRFRVNFWHGLNDVCAEMPAFVEVLGDPSERADNTGNWTDFRFGLPFCHLEARVSKQQKRVQAGIYFPDGARYEELYAKKEEIDGEFGPVGDSLTWVDPDSSKKHRALWVNKKCDFEGDDFSEIHTWTAKMLLKLYEIAMEVYG